MIPSRIYYGVKPILPYRLRMGIRRWFASRQRRRTADRWPIAPGSEQPPLDWPGWPDKKKFALLLTHDVEGSSGLEKCRQLMELEAKLGFRSLFNFIPEGEYRVTPELREELIESGFEVGVHDLHHDGSLFRSREVFYRGVDRINHYLTEWNAVGFRAGFMRHNLEWLHGLKVQYDCSTFDTDPFEPQPDGVNTIFPFWVPRRSEPEGHSPIERCEFQSETWRGHVDNTHSGIVSKDAATLHESSQVGIQAGAECPSASDSSTSLSQGYFEFPYTLPQDSTIFLLFREPTPEIWLRKLDWLVEKGGMALVNVHPDYVSFPGEPASARTYPVEHYIRLLEYIRGRYGNLYWHCLPKELVMHLRLLKTPLIRRVRRRVCIVAYTFYESDARVARYAKALAERGDEVDVLAVKGSPQTPREDCADGIRLFRIQTRKGKENSRFSYLLPLLGFLARSSWWIACEHAARPYDLLHIHNVPDFHVFAAWYPKLRGARVILDIHDIVPEFFASKFHVSSGNWLVRMLQIMERACGGFADHVILANHLWLERYVQRSAARGKCSVIINYVDRRIFFPRPRVRKNGRLLILFPGGLQWHQGLDIAIRAFDVLKAKFPDAEFHIYGEGNDKPRLQRLASELGLTHRVKFFNSLPIEQIAEIMANADLGVVPKRADSFGNEAYSTKIMEFMSLGVPVVVSATRIDQFYFNDNVVRFFESGNHHAMAEAMDELLSSQTLRKAYAEKGMMFAAANNWESRRGDYLRLVDSLCNGIQWPNSRTRPLGVAEPTDEV